MLDDYFSARTVSILCVKKSCLTINRNLEKKCNVIAIDINFLVLAVGIICSVQHRS